MKYILEVNDATKKFSGLMANEAIFQYIYS